MTKHGLRALVAAGLLSCGLPTTSASTAGLGGSCCADLEQRVAELEATTARKGTRKVSLTVTGYVAEQISFWDDGVESNAYVTGLGAAIASNFKFIGQAQIAPGWSSGFTVHVEAFTADPPFVNQLVDDNTASTASLGLQQSFWFLQSDRLGKLGVGLQSHASDSAAILPDGSGTLVTANWVIYDGTSFFLRDERGRFVSSGRGNLRWSDIAFCHNINLGVGADCNGLRLNSIRYDTPTFGGISFATSFGVDDMWDVSARYAAEWNGVKIAAGTAYSEQHDENIFGGLPLVPERDSSYFQAGLYVQHMPTGLFVYSAFGAESNDHRTARVFSQIDPTKPPVFVSGGNDIPDNDTWYLKAGLRRLWNPLGDTVFYGEYAQHNDMISQALIDGIPNPRPVLLGTVSSTFAVDGSQLERWGVGIVQEIDAAAMSLWVKYRNMDGEVEGTTTTRIRDKDETNTVVHTTRSQSKIEFDAIHLFVVAALLNF